MATREDLEKRLETLDQRLRVLEDVEAIQRLKARYGELADARYGRCGVKGEQELRQLAGEIAGLFTEDAIWEGGRALGVCRGRREIYERFRKPTLSLSWHYFVKPQITVEGERARGSWDILAPCTTRDGSPHWMAGFEEDEYARVAGVWLHQRTKLHVVFLAPYERGWEKLAGARAG